MNRHTDLLILLEGAGHIEREHTQQILMTSFQFWRTSYILQRKHSTSSNLNKARTNATVFQYRGRKQLLPTQALTDFCSPDHKLTEALKSAFTETQLPSYPQQECTYNFKSFFYPSGPNERIYNPLLLPMCSEASNSKVRSEKLRIIGAGMHSNPVWLMRAGSRGSWYILEM